MLINVVSLQDIDQNYQKDQKYRFRYYVFSRSFTLLNVMRSQDYFSEPIKNDEAKEERQLRSYAT